MSPIAEMSKKRQLAASVAVGKRLWVTGGLDQTYREIQATEFVDPVNETVQAGPNLPGTFASHCILMVNTSTAMLIGNSIGWQQESWFYNFEGQETGWILGPDLNIGRSSHACGLIKDSESTGMMLVIAAGGEDERSTESFVLGTHEWIMGPDLPYDVILNGVSTPDQKTMLLLGGYNYDKKIEDKIAQFFTLSTAMDKSAI